MSDVCRLYDDEVAFVAGIPQQLVTEFVLGGAELKAFLWGLLELKELGYLREHVGISPACYQMMEKRLSGWQWSLARGCLDPIQILKAVNDPDFAREHPHLKSPGCSRCHGKISWYRPNLEWRRPFAFIGLGVSLNQE